MSEEKPNVVHEDHQVQPKKRGCLGHCKKFWWAYLIGFIAFVLLVVLLIIFVAVPKIAQGKIDDAVLTIEGIVITETEPTQYRMAVNSTITTDGSVHADIDAFTGVMYLEDRPDHKPFASIEFPETTSAELTTVNVSQIVQVEDLDEFAIFNTWLLANETLRMTVEGDTTVHVKGLSKGYGVTFKKTIDLTGINGFHGLEVTKSDVSPALTTNNYNATVDVPNASILTIEIGNATFTNYLDGEDIGTIYMDDLVLYPGINKVTIRGDISQGPILAAMTNQPYCEDGVIPFELQGQNVTKDGTELEYFSRALRELTNAVDVPLTDAFLRASIPLECVDSEDDEDDEEEAEETATTEEEAEETATTEEEVEETSA